MLGTIVLMFVVIAGVKVLLSGFRGRRVGDTPVCCKCEYDLRATDSKRCPECGLRFSANSVLYGRLVRNYVLVVVGTFLITIGSVGLLQVSGRIELYQYYPVAWLADLLDNGDTKAFAELERRLNNGAFSSSDSKWFLTKCLDRHARLCVSAPSYWNWAHLLDNLQTAGNLSASESLQYFQQTVTFPKISMPSLVRKSGVLHINFSYLNKLPPSGLYEEFMWIGISIGDRDLVRQDVGFRFHADRKNGTSAGEMWFDVNDIPGKYTVRINAKIVIHRMNGIVWELPVRMEDTIEIEGRVAHPLRSDGWGRDVWSAM